MAAKPSVDVCGIKITSPARVVFALDGHEVTKVDVARLVATTLAPRMLPYVRGRPVTVVRCPSGGAGPSFFQKHAMKGMPAPIDTIEVIDRSGPTQCLSVHDAAGLVGLVQMNALEFHTWGSQDGDCETPDRLVFDLDPAEDVSWPAVVDAARMVRALLARDGLVSFVKTTGGKGLHVVAPIQGASWHETGRYGDAIANEMVSAAPDKYTGNMKKKLRTGKIFLDFARNMRGATAVAPWSIRTRGTIATPVSWDELESVRGSTWNVVTIADRLRVTDPWAAYVDVRQRLSTS